MREGPFLRSQDVVPLVLMLCVTLIVMSLILNISKYSIEKLKNPEPTNVECKPPTIQDKIDNILGRNLKPKASTIRM